jgi:hypothetical protein
MENEPKSERDACKALDELLRWAQGKIRGPFRNRIVQIVDYAQKVCPVDLAGCEYHGLASRPGTPPGQWPLLYGEWLAGQLAGGAPVELWKWSAWGTWLAVEQKGDSGVAINGQKIGGRRNPSDNRA